MNLPALTAAIGAVCPIDGVSIGDPSDKATWRIDAQSDATPAQRAAAAALVAAWVDPLEPVPLTFLEFLSLFTPSEAAALVGSADVRVKLFVIMAAGATQILLDDPRIGPGLALCHQLGLVTADRATQILAGKPAPTA